VIVTDTIPNGTSFVSASDSGTEVGGVVTWPTFDLAAGATVTRQVTVLVDDPLDVTILSIINTASVTDDGSNGDDPTPDDNTATDTDSLGLAGKDLLWEGPQDNTGMPLVRIGEMFTYRVVLGVAPGATLENLVLTDVLDRGLVFMNCAVSGGSLTADPAHPFGNMCAAPIPVSTEPSGSTNPADVGRKLTLNFGTVVNPSTEAGDFITVYYDVVVLNSAENVQGVLLNNAAEWSWDGGSYPLTARDVKVVEPKLDIVKTVTPTEVMPGQEVTFTMTIEHTTASEIDAYDVVLTDKVPSGLTYVPGSLQFISGQTPTLIDESGAPTLRVSWDVFADNNQKTIIRFKATVGAIGAGDSVKNVANLAWSSMPGDWSDPITPISPVLSTERFFTPGSSINTYGANSSASLGVPEEVVLPETGFAPGKVTPLGQQPADAYQEITDLVLEIPSLKVSTGIVGVPLKGGEWDLTWLGTQAGYLEGTSFPTWAGNSAITAHVYNADGNPGPFNQLGTLKWGDVVKVKAFGLTYTYAVRSVAVVQPGDLSVLKHEDTSWLTLITCKGYNIAEDSYSQRVVVRAVLVNVGAE
jgi:LPXTG-site transpeptidase (sortase) family protein